MFFFLCLLTQNKIRAFFFRICEQVALQESPPDMTLSRDALAPRYVAVVGAAVVGAATVAGAGVVRSYLARRRRRPACEPPPSLQLFDRYSSNNSARIRFWIYIRGLEASIASRQITHEEQHEQWFADVNPHRKIPALLIGDANRQWLAESAIILEYLEDLHEQGAWSATAVAVNASRSSLVPAAPVDRAHMNLVIRTHDLYLASPNCTQPGPFTHVQGCFYVGVPGRGGTRWIERSVRAALLKECWEQLDNLEDLLRGPFFAGARPSLADLTVWPTIVVFVFLAPRVYAWEPTAVFHNRPKLRQWFEKEMKGESSAVTRRDGDAATASLRRAVQRSISRVEDELVRSLQMKESSGMLEEIIAETRDCTYKWIYP